MRNYVTLGMDIAFIVALSVVMNSVCSAATGPTGGTGSTSPSGTASPTPSPSPKPHHTHRPMKVNGKIPSK